MNCQELQSGPCCSRATEGSVERHCTAVATPCQVTSAVSCAGSAVTRVTDSLHAHKFGQMSMQRDFFHEVLLD